jgi:hypothetical protein
LRERSLLGETARKVRKGRAIKRLQEQRDATPDLSPDRSADPTSEDAS